MSHKALVKSEIQILHASTDWWVVSKPEGMSVHNEPGKDLLSSAKQLLKMDLLPVHRLDKETSGIILLASSPQTAALLSQALSQPETSKTYRAILRGNIQTESWEWKQSLTDKAEGRMNPQGKSADRIPCLSIGKRIRANSYLSEVQLQIKSGRQHQIRKHAALNKHPVVNDKRYNDEKYNKMIQARYGIDRMFLHAEILELKWQGEFKKFESPCPFSLSDFES